MILHQKHESFNYIFYPQDCIMNNIKYYKSECLWVKSRSHHDNLHA